MIGLANSCVNLKLSKRDLSLIISRIMNRVKEENTYVYLLSVKKFGEKFSVK